jgi:hypothetical protein
MEGSHCYTPGAKEKKVPLGSLVPYLRCKVTGEEGLGLGSGAQGSTSGISLEECCSALEPGNGQA